MDVKTVDPKITPKIAPTFAKNLRRMMEEKGLNAYRLSEQTGLGSPSIYRFLDPKYSSDPTASTLLKLCRALQCELADLISL